MYAKCEVSYLLRLKNYGQIKFFHKQQTKMALNSIPFRGINKRIYKTPRHLMPLYVMSHYINKYMPCKQYCIYLIQNTKAYNYTLEISSLAEIICLSNLHLFTILNKLGVAITKMTRTLWAKTPSIRTPVLLYNFDHNPQNFSHYEGNHPT